MKLGNWTSIFLFPFFLYLQFSLCCASLISSDFTSTLDGSSAYSCLLAQMQFSSTVDRLRINIEFKFYVRSHMQKKVHEDLERRLPLKFCTEKKPHSSTLNILFILSSRAR